MKYFNLFLYEWKHFVRNRFKVVAIVLFVVAAVYGLHKGASLYEQQQSEIAKIEKRIQEDRQEIIDDHYNKDEFSPEDRPWVDYGEPFWAIWSSYAYHFKKPSPAMVYSIGQAEQYGFYKRLTMWASPYDSDLAEEIANPERLQTGTLDFSFVLLFLLPLVLLVLLYNLKSAESEQGFLPLIQVQNPSKNTWLLSRICFYIVLLFAVVTALIFYGTLLTPVLESAAETTYMLLIYSLTYLLFWGILFFLVLRKSKSILSSTLQMSALFLLFAFIIPASVHQVMSIRQPANMMTDLIDVRDQEQELYNESDSVFQAKLNELFPEILDSPAYKDSAKIDEARNSSGSALSNELNKTSIRPIEKENQSKNKFIRGTFWFNPVSFFQNRFNHISETHYDDYQNYRNEIQELIDKQIKTLVLDTWYDKRVNARGYNRYIQKLQEL